MPFGAVPLDDGGVRFRLWAPAASQVELVLHDQQELPMAAKPEGWFECVTDRATVGCLYRFCIDGADTLVPDPASRHQPQDVHGPSEVIDPLAFDWQDDAWPGRPWREAVFYELHVGSFTPEGTFAGVEHHLDELVELGVTALELMPVADFPGRHGWGYDGVLPFAPDTRYGTPETLKKLVQAAHARGLMIFLDVVYNHFGPEGNYLHLYAPQFFNPAHQTPWGAAINFDGADNHWVRQFFIHNALYWLEEYHFDGLRLDAVHAIADSSEPDILQELANSVSTGPGRRRQLHLVLENDNNQAHYMAREPGGEPRWYRAQWNDDLHHALHVLITGESEGYYEDYIEHPVKLLGRCLTEGFAYQGEPSRHRDGACRGEPSAHLPPTAFVSFLENHDQIGNRAFGERPSVLANREAVGCVLSIVLLAPAPPLLFMGQEWGSQQPFPFFCDFGDDLAEAVTEGRRREFARFPEFADPANRERIPDPMSEQTFRQAVLEWKDRERPEGRFWLAVHRDLLRLRREVIVPRLQEQGEEQGWRADYRALGQHTLQVNWRFPDGSHWRLLANLSATPAPPLPMQGRLLFAWPGKDSDVLPGWSTAWYLSEADDG